MYHYYRCARTLLSGLPLLLALGTAAARADSLHAGWQDQHAAALVDQMLTTLAEDVRSNRLFLNTSPEQLRSFLLQRLCLTAGGICVDPAVGIPVSQLGLAPADIDLLLQHLSAALQIRQLSPLQQQRLLQQFSLQALPPDTARPLASL